MEAFNKTRSEAKTLSPVTDTKGRRFDRFVQIFLSDVDFSEAARDPSFQWIARQGITLSKYISLEFGGKANYVAAVSGQTHFPWTLAPMDPTVDNRPKTVVDLLDPANVSWGTYAEDLPYTGFKGSTWWNANGEKAYVRRHNPLMGFKSVTENPDRLAKMKNFTMFYEDLLHNKLPQWMYIVPNTTNSGYLSFPDNAGKWAKSFLEPLLVHPHFTKKTLIILTFDAPHSIRKERVFTVVLGDIIEESNRGGENDWPFNHYSLLKTAEWNWRLASLMRADLVAKFIDFGR